MNCVKQSWCSVAPPLLKVDARSHNRNGRWCRSYNWSPMWGPTQCGGSILGSVRCLLLAPGIVIEAEDQPYATVRVCQPKQSRGTSRPSHSDPHTCNTDTAMCCRGAFSTWENCDFSTSRVKRSICQDAGLMWLIWEQPSSVPLCSRSHILVLWKDTHELFCLPPTTDALHFKLGFHYPAKAYAGPPSKRISVFQQAME